MLNYIRDFSGLNTIGKLKSIHIKGLLFFRHFNAEILYIKSLKDDKRQHCICSICICSAAIKRQNNQLMLL